jgi:hypothetical protein
MHFRHIAQHTKLQSECHRIGWFSISYVIYRWKLNIMPFTQWNNAILMLKRQEKNTNCSYKNLKKFDWKHMTMQSYIKSEPNIFTISFYSANNFLLGRKYYFSTLDWNSCRENYDLDGLNHLFFKMFFLMVLLKSNVVKLTKFSRWMATNLSLSLRILETLLRRKLN